MFWSFPATRVAGGAVLVLVILASPRAADAEQQSKSVPEQHEHGTPPKPSAPSQGQVHDHSQMTAEHRVTLREGSGTSWLPDASLMYAIHQQRGQWELMGHGNGFLQYLDDAGARGHDQFGSINWMMGMAHRNIGAGRLGLRGMLSLEPATTRGCGYPDLLATGEQCDGAPIRDQQHQHDLFMEIAATYDRPLVGAVRWQVYGGPAAEPALGPVAYPHRLSAMPNLLAPITHHWLDATHITFGVVTGGVYGNRWKAEASAFNGREPDEERTGFDLAPLDSVSGRIWLLPTANVAIQLSAGHLTEAEPADDGRPRVDVTRVTASATYHRLIGEGGIWASTAAWGTNEEDDHGTHALLLETNLTRADRDSWFGRFELVGKSAHDLDVPHSLVHDVEGRETFTVAKVQGGYTRYLNTWKGLKPGVGVSASAGFVPRTLEVVYGSRVNPGFGIYLTVRPAVMRMAMGGGQPTGSVAPAAPAGHEHEAPKSDAPAQATPAPADRKAEPRAIPMPTPAGEPRLPVLPAERVVDPACAKTIDLTTAPRATYQGKVFYFCSPADRDEFLKDPAAYLKKRGQK